MAKEQYIYAVTRVHTQETGLLSQTDIDQLLAATDVGDIYRLLGDKGWATTDLSVYEPDALIQAETDKTWGLIEELIGDVSEFDVFRYGNDFHNLKAAIKLAYTAYDKDDRERFFAHGGTVDVETIVQAVEERDFSALSADMQTAGEEAYEVLAHTGNGQLCDMVIDRAALIAIDRAGKETDSELLRRYAQITVDSANIKAAVRCRRMGKDKAFIERAVAPAGTLNSAALIDAAADSIEAIYSFLSRTAYAGAVDALKTSMASFERWGDNQMIEMIKPQRYNYFGIEPLAAYILGRQNEIAMVRLIISAKVNELDSDVVRERLRDMYV